MEIYFAEVVTIPNTVAGLLGLIITTLCGVIVWQQARLDKNTATAKVEYKELQDKYDDLQELRLADHKGELSKVTEALQDVAQRSQVLTEKINSVRGVYDK